MHIMLIILPLINLGWANLIIDADFPVDSYLDTELNDQEEEERTTNGWRTPQ